MSPCQQCAAYKQIRLTDDTVEALVSPENHLSTAVWTEGSDETAPFSPSLSPSVYSSSLSCSSSPKHRLTLFRASWKVISHYFLRCLSSHRNTVTCQHSATARKIMSYVCVSLSVGLHQLQSCFLCYFFPSRCPSITILNYPGHRMRHSAPH